MTEPTVGLRDIQDETKEDGTSRGICNQTQDVLSPSEESQQHRNTDRFPEMEEEDEDEEEDIREQEDSGLVSSKQVLSVEFFLFKLHTINCELAQRKWFLL